MRVLLLCLLLGAKGLWKHLAILPRGVMVRPPYLPWLSLSSRCEAQVDLHLLVLPASPLCEVGRGVEDPERVPFNLLPLFSKPQ